MACFYIVYVLDFLWFFEIIGFLHNTESPQADKPPQRHKPSAASEPDG